MVVERDTALDHDHLGHVVLHRLDHHLVLQGRPGHLHAARPADGGMGDVAIAGDLMAWNGGILRIDAYGGLDRRFLD